MEALTMIYYLLLLVCYFFAIFLIIYIYQNNYKPYELKLQEHSQKELPSDLEPGEISMLMYHKIEPQVLTTTILSLIQKGVVELKMVEKEYCFKVLNVPGRVNLSRSENVVKEFLEKFNAKDEFTLTDFEQYCGTKKGDSEFLFQYDLFKNIVKRESSRKHFFEQKKGYSMIKLMRNFGLLLFFTNILGGYHIFSGYGILLPSLFVPVFFYKTYRRTEHYNEEYEKWNLLKDYLNNLKNNEGVNDIHRFTKSAIILEEIDSLYKVKPNDRSLNFAYSLNKAILKCHRYAYFNGNRSISDLWSFK